MHGFCASCVHGLELPGSSMRIFRNLLLLTGAALLASCAVKQETYDVPKVQLPEKFAQAPAVTDATVASHLLPGVAAPENALSEAAPLASTGGAAAQSADSPSSQAVASGQAVPATPLSTILPEWWRMLGSEELNHLIDRGLANNHDLRIAALRVVQLNARKGIAGAAKLPTITLPVQSDTYYPEWGIGNPNNAGRARTTHQISLRADWRPDLWGENAALYESAEFQLMRATYQRDDMQRLVVARLVADYLEYLSLNDRLRVNQETEKTLKEMIASVKVRMDIGDATITDLEQQRSAVYAVRATIPVLEQQRVVVQNRIASTVGTVPEELSLSDFGMDTIASPALLPGVPSTLLLRRPDVRAVEARLLAAEADIDVARARLLPPLDLTAQAGFGSRYLSTLFSSPQLLWNTVANLSITLFDSGKRDKEVEFAKAIHEEMVETYIRVIYDAVREVDDSLGAYRNMGQQVEEQEVATKSAFLAWNYSQEAYVAGAVDYLVMLDAERSYQRNLDDLYRYRLESWRGLVSLYSALGGGVHMGGELPGKGYRPAAMPKEVEYGVAVDHATSAGHAGGFSANAPVSVDMNNTAPSIGQVEGIDWDGQTLHAGEESWLVELFGTFDRGAIFSAWRDMRARFPALVEGHQLLPRRQNGVEVNELERQSWYRIFISAFPARQAADDVCASLRAGMQHCGVVSSSSLRGNDPFNAARTLNNSKVKPVRSSVAAQAALPVVAKAAKEATAPEVLVPEQQIRRAVQDWADAWSAGKAGNYLAAYTLDYRPNGMSQFDWLKQRQGLLRDHETAQIDVRDIRVSLQDETHASTSFMQVYRRESGLERQAKTLQMVRQGDKWLIAAESPETPATMHDEALPGPLSSVSSPPGATVSADREFWLVELPPAHDQEAVAGAWRDLRKRFPVQMKVRSMLISQQDEPIMDGDKPQRRYRLFIARFPEKAMAAEFCGMLHAARQPCDVQSSNSLAQREAFNASWFTNRGFAFRQERAELQ